ncbi:hypothetical protein F4824DRAFT_445132 [Ustulina deusta]|nr:hypothetical protein F4824DRAFT_445132 [Ustulina deusta]
MTTSDDPRIKFGLSCPVGGNFHICQDSSTKFIGCCDVDPCTPGRDGECPTSKLFSASFSAASGVLFLPQSCADPFNSSIWYTCDNAKPPFLGCCTNNPCNGGCLAGNLEAATLSKDPKNAGQFMLPDTTTTTTTTILSTIGTSVLPTGTESSSPSPTDGGGARAGMIAGISVAGVVILLLVIAAYLWVKRREHARQKCEQQTFLDDPSAGAIQSNEFFQATPHLAKSAFLAHNSHRPSNGTPSPSKSENFHSPHLSLLSELEGSSRMNTALQQNLRDTHNSYEWHELRTN